MKNQHEDQGFQAMNDHDEREVNYSLRPHESPAAKQRPEQRRKRNYVHSKPKNDKTQTLQTPTDLHNSPTSFPQPLSTITAKPNSKSRASQPKKVEPKYQSKLPRQKRFVSIPIIYDTPLDEIRGKPIYRGLMPRTSDNYFRLLKEVNWQLPAESRKVGRWLQFNSRFEGGNLASVRQVRLGLFEDFFKGV